jgi:hypothetical protein
MEIKNVADCETGIMMQLEIMAPKEEIQKREFTRDYGAGTALLLCLSKPWKGSGHIMVADSAFASVKSAVMLKRMNGLYFLGLVKTAYREFPKKWMNEANIDARGDFVALTAEKDSIQLKAVAWNDNKRKNVVATCGTTLSGRPHKKRRWKIHNNRTIEYYYKEVPRNAITAEYFDGAQAIDVHNHLRQSGLALEEHTRKTWDGRFFQTFLGMIEVDAYLAFRHFNPGNKVVSHRTFLKAVIACLMNNKYGLPSSAPVLRPRPEEDEEDRESVQKEHTFLSFASSKYFKERQREARAKEENGDHAPHLSARVRCSVCRNSCFYYCQTCSTECKTSMKNYVGVCGLKTKRNCIALHQKR